MSQKSSQKQSLFSFGTSWENLDTGTPNEKKSSILR